MYRGNWTADIEDYLKEDIVAYQNLFFIALQNVPMGVNPNDVEYWKELEDIRGKSFHPTPVIAGKGKDGRGIISITKVSEEGNVDTYAIIYTDGTCDHFQVTNGIDGAQGPEGPQGPEGEPGPQGVPGRGVEHVVINNDNHLIVTYTDGNTEDAGEVHVGYVRVDKPTISDNSFVYDGIEHGPTIMWPEGTQQYCEVINASAVNAGTYTLTIRLKNVRTSIWNDGTTADITYTYTIAKATATITVNPVTIALNHQALSADVEVSWTGESNQISLSIADSTIATLSQSVLLEAGTFTVTATEVQGSTSVTLLLPGTDNYASAELSIPVVANFIALKTFSAATEEELLAMVQAADRGEIDLYEDCGWRVGQSRVVLISAIEASGTYDGISWNVGESQPQQYIELTLMHRGAVELVTPVYNVDKSQRTTCSFVVGVPGILSVDGYVSNENIPTNYWGYCLRHAWCNSGFRQSLPESIRAAFKKFKCIAGIPNMNTYSQPGGENTITEDYFTLPAVKEVTGQRSSACNNESDALFQFEWYETPSNRDRQRSYWFRSAFYGSNHDTAFYSAASGVVLTTQSSSDKALCPFGVM